MQRNRKPAKGGRIKASVFLSRSLHHRASIRAINRRMPLSDWIAELVEKAVKPPARIAA